MCSMPILTQEQILKEIAEALSHRKKLQGQINNLEQVNNSLETEVSSLERIGFAVAAAGHFPSAPTTSTAPCYLPPSRQNGFTSVPFQTSPVKPSPTVQHAIVSAQMPQTTQTAPSRKPSSSGGARRSQEWPDIPEICKIEEKDPNILAQKILETGRQIEAVKYGTELTPRGSSADKKLQGAEKGRGSSARSTKTSAPKATKQKPLHQETISSPVSQASTSQSSFSMPSPSPSPLTLRALPIQHAESTPRVNDFEDRLKNLITSVLNDNSKNAADVPHEPAPSISPHKHLTAPVFRGADTEREGLFARAPPKSILAIQHAHIHQQLPDYTQYSPAKLALRRHLSQEKLSSPVPQFSKLAEAIHARNFKDDGSLDSERSLDSYSGGHIHLSSAMYRALSPVSRPGSTDCHPLIPSSSSVSEAHSMSNSFGLMEPPHNVEGLAASLCGRVRNSIDEPGEPSSPPSSAALVEDSSVHEADDGAKKKKACLDPPAEKSDVGETQSRKWQDKINSRFDRLMNFASNEMDKRRRSTESSSPRTEPFCSPRGKESSVPALPSSGTEERPAEKKSDGKDPQRKEKDRDAKGPKDSKDPSRSDRKRERSTDGDRSSSRSSKSSRDKDRDKDKEKDRDHRKHSGKHDKKKTDNPDETKSKESEKERDKSKEKSRSKDRAKDKKEPGEKRSEDRSDKHKHRDREKDKDRDKDKERRRDKEKHREKSSKSSRDSNKSGVDDSRKEDHGHRSSKSSKDEESVSKPQESVGQDKPVGNPQNQVLANHLQMVARNIKAEVEIEERTQEHSNDGHHHFKKRIVQCQMEWDHDKAEYAKDERHTQVKHEVIQPTFLNQAPHEVACSSEHGSKSKTAIYLPHEDNGPYPRSLACEPPQRQESAEGESPRAKTSNQTASTTMSQPIASGVGKSSETPQATASVLNLYPPAAYGSAPSSDISPQRYAQYQQHAAGRAGPTHFEQPTNYLAGMNLFATLNVTLGLIIIFLTRSQTRLRSSAAFSVISTRAAFISCPGTVTPSVRVSRRPTIPRFTCCTVRVHKWE